MLGIAVLVVDVPVDVVDTAAITLEFVVIGTNIVDVVVELAAVEV